VSNGDQFAVSGHMKLNIPVNGAITADAMGPSCLCQKLNWFLTYDDAICWRTAAANQYVYWWCL